MDLGIGDISLVTWRFSYAVKGVVFSPNDEGRGLEAAKELLEFREVCPVIPV
ncbi:hypothetical protein [Chitinophaga tropicalis]|uniref:Uncharacterized protein n=1 Tax=Chitinophaga tropicalis TaxID=2683588 RepID=A0A7K1U249_9BACT|nr:hypothetical protein [Chitinophaga tropicalis]MVT08380.1 hypothetical protein [Chitinophaga tropicalis]